MSTSQRVSRGFHRLAIFLAAVPLLVGGSWGIVTGFSRASDASRDHEKVLCAHEYLARARDQPSPNFKLMFAPDSERLNLKEIGCSYSEHDTVSFGEAWNPPQFNWFGVLAPTLAFKSRYRARRLTRCLCGGPRDRLGHWRLCCCLAALSLMRLSRTSSRSISSQSG